MNQNILVETGTNEVELLEFFVGDQGYAVNVLKVKQIAKYDDSEITSAPGVHPSVAGVMIYQGESIPVVHLANYLGKKSGEDDRYRVVIICEFNQTTNGFIVDNVNRIHRLSWEAMQPMQISQNAVESKFTSVCHIENRQVLVLDFESIAAEIFNIRLYETSEEDVPSEENKGKRKDKLILMADDSALVRETLSDFLKSSGYNNVIVFDNGQSLFDEFKSLDQQNLENENTPGKVSLILTDIEMPILDGFTLCKKVKDMSSNTPVLILSSLVNEQIIEKGKAVSADECVSKNEVSKLLPLIDKMTGLG